MYKISILALILATCYLILATDAKAQNFSVAIDPPILQIKAEPPANISAPISIENLGSQPVDLNILLMPFKPSDRENGQVMYLSEVPPAYSSVFEKTRILDQGSSIKSLSLGPKQKKELILNVNMPRDIDVSDYYFSVVFARSPSSGQASQDNSGTELLGGIAINVLLSTGEKQTKGVIQEFSAPLLVENGPVAFSVRVKNTGNHYITPKGTIVIKNLFGQAVGKVDLQSVNILTGSVRAIPSEVESGEALWKEKFILGPYIAFLTLSLSENVPLLERQIVFFAFPGTTILLGLVALITLLYLYSRIRTKI